MFIFYLLLNLKGTGNFLRLILCLNQIRLKLQNTMLLDKKVINQQNNTRQNSCSFYYLSSSYSTKESYCFFLFRFLVFGFPVFGVIFWFPIFGLPVFGFSTFYFWFSVFRIFDCIPNPIDVISNVCINTRIAFGCAAIAPRNNTSQYWLSVENTCQWSA